MKNKNIIYPFTGIVGQEKIKKAHGDILNIDEGNLLSEYIDKSILEVADLFNSERRIP